MGARAPLGYRHIGYYSAHGYGKGQALIHSLFCLILYSISGMVISIHKTQMYSTTCNSLQSCVQYIYYIFY